MISFHDDARSARCARRSPLDLAAIALAFLASCGGDAAPSGGSGASTATTTVSSSGAGSAGAGGAAAMVDRGPTSIPLDGDPGGLWWDAATATLFIADHDKNRILQYRDGVGVSLYAELGLAPASGPGLGQIVRMADGALVVPRFGFGTDGDVAILHPDKTTTIVPGLDPLRRRIGLTLAPDGTLYDTYFTQTNGTKIGAVARLDLKGTETDVVSGLQKPVGVLADSGNLIVSDQVAGTVVSAPVASPDKLTVLAQMSGPDLLCAGPNGSYFTGGKTGSIRQIFGDEKYSDFAGGFQEVRGVAYDASNKRLFAANHDGSGSANKLEIVPVD